MEEVYRAQGGVILKNKSYVVAFDETILVSLWKFQQTLVYIYIYIYMCVCVCVSDK